MASHILPLFLAFLAAAHGEYTLRMLDTEYLPTTYNSDGSATYIYNTGAVEQCALDKNQPIIYATGLHNLHIIDYSDPTDLETVYNVEIGADELTVEATDVEICDKYVAVSIDDFINPLVGRVQIWSAYDAQAEPPMQMLADIEVGSMPDMIKFTSDCRTLVVAVEAELRIVDGEAVDPEGEVTIIDFQDGIPGDQYNIRVASFTKFNDLEAEYVSRGVRKIYNGQGTGFTTTFAQDMEPEYIQINSDNSIAYVVLQENNAMAVVDIANADVTEIFPLGFRDHQESPLDGSDRDGVAFLRSYPIYGIPNPDGMALITIDGEDYMLTANEGDAKEYDSLDWAESQRAKRFEDDDFASSVSPVLKDAMSSDSLLGRLEMSVVDGQNQNGEYERFYSYGSRDFSLFRASDFSEVYSSGDEFERILANEFTSIFNTNPNSDSATPEGAFDTRSDNKGPEPEAIVYGEVDGETLVFIGFERPSQLVIYKLDNSGSSPTFTYESMSYFGGFGDSWENLYARRETSDLGPEDIRFIPASESVTGTPLLVSASTYSGTVSVFEVVQE